LACGAQQDDCSAGGQQRAASSMSRDGVTSTIGGGVVMSVMPNKTRLARDGRSALVPLNVRSVLRPFAFAVVIRNDNDT
jgi:hypothetical protein